MDLRASARFRFVTPCNTMCYKTHPSNRRQWKVNGTVLQPLCSPPHLSRRSTATSTRRTATTITPPPYRIAFAASPLRHLSSHLSPQRLLSFIAFAHHLLLLLILHIDTASSPKTPPTSTAVASTTCSSLRSSTISDFCLGASSLVFHNALAKCSLFHSRCLSPFRCSSLAKSGCYCSSLVLIARTRARVLLSHMHLRSQYTALTVHVS